MKGQWITFERATVERARELLAAGGDPVILRWSRSDRSGKGGGWEPMHYTETVALVDVTEKRLKVRTFHRAPSGPVISGPIYIADPKKCRFAEWREGAK